MQADLTIGGRARKVIMQANKNGFFYVLDRATGEFISGTPFVSGITWATGLDPKTGRPIEAPTGYAGLKPVIVSPSSDGAHNWNPMAFSPATGLVYLPAKVGTQFLHAPDAKWKYDPNRGNVGADEMYDGPLNAKLDSLPLRSGELVAWDPVAQKAAWRASYPVVGRRRRSRHRRQSGVSGTRGRRVRRLSRHRRQAALGVRRGHRNHGAAGDLPDRRRSVCVRTGGVGRTPGLFNDPGSGPVKPGYGRILTFMLDGTATLKAPAFGHKDLRPRPPSPPTRRRRWCMKEACSTTQTARAVMA